MRSQSARPSARVFDVDGFSWVFVEPVGDMLVRALSVAKDVVFLGDMGVHSLRDESHIRISLTADEEMVSRLARLVLARELSRSERFSCARGQRSAGGDSLQPIVEDPELTMRQGDRDGQEDELDARLLAPLRSIFCRFS